jgi:threonine/homoserine/homoserine lactone efflux protein
MQFSVWLSIAAICLMGALSPGPSLAVVVRNTVNGGRIQGVITAISHGIGVGLYAFLTAAGLAVVVVRHPALFETIRWSGAAFLLYLGLRSLIFPDKPGENSENIAEVRRGAEMYALLDGFLIAFLNPKIAVFFLALFSQFVRPNAPLTEKIIMASTAWAIDTLWYVTVALALSGTGAVTALRRRATILDRLFGVVLIALAVRVVI